MTGLAELLSVLCGIVAVGGGVWFVVLAFQKSVGWGLAVLFLPFAGLIFTVKNWKAAKVPFLMLLLGAPLAVVAQAMSQIPK